MDYRQEKTTTYRADAIYVEYLTRKALQYVPRDPDEDQTIDGLANWIIMEWLLANHPKVIEHLKAQSDADWEFRKAYKETQTPF